MLVVLQLFLFQFLCSKPSTVLLACVVVEVERSYSTFAELRYHTGKPGNDYMLEPPVEHMQEPGAEALGIDCKVGPGAY